MFLQPNRILNLSNCGITHSNEI